MPPLRMEIVDYVKARIFPPIGIENFGWAGTEARGTSAPTPTRTVALRLPARDFARLGYLLLRGGAWRASRSCRNGGLT
jgi:CubicO group peptidase (beta-lactamase class C family)